MEDALVVAKQYSLEVGLVATSRSALLVTDRSGRIRFANPAAGALLNCPPEKLATGLLVSHVEPAHRRAFRACLHRAAAGETVEFSTELAPARMRPFPAQARVTPLDGDLGWTLHEEAEDLHRHASNALERVQFGQVLEAVRDGVVVLDRELRVRFVNRAAQAMLAPQRVEIGQPVPDPWTVSIHGLVHELFEHEAYNVEAVVEPEQRTAFWIRAYQSGAGETAVLLLSDVTAEERREQAERDFVAHAAHELQSPLTGISSAVEVLLSGGSDDESARLLFLEHIERETERLARLVRNLLVLAQAQATESEAEAEDFELRPLLLEIAGAEPDEARIEVVAPRLSVNAHRGLVEHAISNLVSNAVRHGAGQRVVLAARRAGGGVKVEVSDFGRGIAVEQRLRVFERFYRGGTTDAEGFGLGLAIAQQAARAVGGEIELRPNPRGGTIAELTLRGA